MNTVAATDDNLNGNEGKEGQFVTKDPYIQELMSDPDRWYKHSQQFWQVDTLPNFHFVLPNSELQGSL